MHQVATVRLEGSTENFLAVPSCMVDRQDPGR